MECLDHQGKINAGQDKFFSKTCHNLSAKSSSVITRLASWSLSEQNIQIHVNQHFGYKLHLVWKIGKNISLKKYRARKWKARNTLSAERSIERCFYLYSRLEKICTELKYGR